jgi:hypothetical protein
VACPGLAAESPAKTATILSFDGRHPLTHGLLLDRLVAKTNVALAETGEPLVRGGDGPLLLAISGGGRRAVASAFKLADSNFPVLEGAFPVFARRAFLWLARDQHRTVAFCASGPNPAGPLFGLPAMGPRRLGAWTLPTGETTTASLLDRSTTAIAPAAGQAEPILEEGAPKIIPLAAPVATAAAAALGAALLVELWVLFLERRRGALPRGASAL